MICANETCSNTFEPRPWGVNSKRYCSSSCRTTQVTRDRRRKIASLISEAHGHSCSACGYDRCNSALELHHEDLIEKEFNLSRGSSKALSRVKAEIDKCVQLCSNCHKEEHRHVPVEKGPEECAYEPCSKSREAGRFCSNKCKNKHGVTMWRRRTKRRAIELKGGKCQSCGYDRYDGALEFHHLDPEKKEFQISSGNTRSWAKIEEELRECELLCSNCHREVHHSDSG